MVMSGLQHDQRMGLSHAQEAALQMRKQMLSGLRYKLSAEVPGLVGIRPC